MFPAGIITFREALEASLVVGIVLSYVTKTNQLHFRKYVWYGIGTGILLSLVVAFLLDLFFDGMMQGKTESVFEGILMFVTVGFLTWMILWVHRQKEIAKRIREQVAAYMKNGFGLGIFLISLTSVFREGSEAVLYLKAMSLAGVHDQFIGAILGILVALLLGFLLFSLFVRIQLKTIFSVTTWFLLLFAAGMIASGVHEFQEAGLLPVFSFDPLFNVSSILNQKSILGVILHALFGYNSKPTILEVDAYGVYIVFILWLKKRLDRILFTKAL